MAMGLPQEQRTQAYWAAATLPVFEIGYPHVLSMLTRVITAHIFRYLRVLHQMCSSLALVALILGAFFHQPAQAKVFATQMSSRVVQTQYGPVRDVLITLPNSHLHDVEAYLGLQYASLLDGDLRFMPPTSPMEKWDTVKVAMKFRPVCPQRLPDIEALQKRLPIGRVEHFERLIPFLEDQAEECLNLNVYVPTGKNALQLLSIVGSVVFLL